LAKLRDAFKKAMDNPEFLEIMAKIYIPPSYRTPEEYQTLVGQEYKECEAMIYE
jgi:tripartite-type tricarboxylate transporter receptor subunit TctC